jgi:hypothetical protein
LVTFGNEASARTIVIAGTNADGNPIQETLAIPSGGGATAATVQDFATLTSILPLGGGWTAAATVGTDTVASSPWKLTNAQNQAVSEISISGVVSGTISWGIEYTYNNPNNNSNVIGSQVLGNDPIAPTPWTLAALTAQIGNADAAIDNPIAAWRAVILSGSGSVTITAIEGGIAESR